MTRIYPFQRTARWLSLAFLAMALLLGSWAQAWAQEEEKQKLKIPDRPENTMRNEVEAKKFEGIKVLDKGLDGKPLNTKEVEALSPHHAMLHRLAGHWEVQARIYMEPGADPVDSRGAVRNTMILGGRALQSEYKGTMMGEPFIGMGLDGYDMEKEEHYSVWLDNTSTGLTLDRGGCRHDEIDVVTYEGELIDPQSGDPIQRKVILTVRSMSRYTYEEWQSRDGGEPTLSMQIIYSKKN